MGSFADFLENAVLNLVFGNTAFTPAANVFVGLSTTTITDAGGNITEPSGVDGYARVSVPNDKTASGWTTSTTGTLENAAAITFPQATGSWGTVIDFFISDASTGGNIYAFGTLTVAKTINNGDTAEFAAGALDISLD